MSDLLGGTESKAPLEFLTGNMKIIGASVNDVFIVLIILIINCNY